MKPILPIIIVAYRSHDEIGGSLGSMMMRLDGEHALLLPSRRLSTPFL